LELAKLRQMIHDRRHREEVYSTSQYWDKKAAEYSGDAISMWPNNHLNKLYHNETLQALQEYIPDPSNKELLDLGCGTGRLSRYFAGRGARVLGIDYAPKTIDIARRNDPEGKAQYRVQSVFELEETNRFDIVITWAMLCFPCHNETELLNLLIRVKAALKPGGEVIFIEPIHSGFLHRVLKMTPGQFRRTMLKAGFEIDGIRHLSFWPVRLLLAYVAWPRWFTVMLYHLGQWKMKYIFNNHHFGDYQVYHGRVPSATS
jgi:2-polyprenyl-3-methyl-5-hydroxy-6-metoxy-1,4-benzoquinol methylase